jgi:hypothetical protein
MMHPIFLQVLRTAVGHRLAKVQGYLFRAAFLRRVPTFTRLIIENLLLCFLQSAIYQTSKYLTGSLGLRFKKILTDLVHADYFEVCWVIKLESPYHLQSAPFCQLRFQVVLFCPFAQNNELTFSLEFSYLYRSNALENYVMFSLKDHIIIGLTGPSYRIESSHHS